MKAILVMFLLTALTTVAADRYWVVAQESHGDDPAMVTLDASVSIELPKSSDLIATTNDMAAKMIWDKVGVSLITKTEDGTKTVVLIKLGTGTTQKGGILEAKKVASVYLSLCEVPSSGDTVLSATGSVFVVDADLSSRAQNIPVTNMIDYIKQRKAWEAYFAGKIYSVSLHAHPHDPGATRPCAIFVVRETDGTEHEEVVGVAFEH